MKTHCRFIGNSILIYIVYVSFLYPMKWFVGDFYKIDVKNQNNDLYLKAL